MIRGKDVCHVIILPSIHHKQCRTVRECVGFYVNIVAHIGRTEPGTATKCSTLYCGNGIGDVNIRDGVSCRINRALVITAVLGSNRKVVIIIFFNIWRIIKTFFSNINQWVGRYIFLGKRRSRLIALRMMWVTSSDGVGWAVLAKRGG